MTRTFQLKLMCSFACVALFLSSGVTYSQDEEGSDESIYPSDSDSISEFSQSSDDSDLGMGDMGSGYGSAPLSSNQSNVSPDKAAACGVIIAKLKGKDNSQGSAKSEKSPIPGNWSLACSKSKVNYDTCSLSAQCNDSKGKMLGETTINLASCADKEVKSSMGSLICN